MPRTPCRIIIDPQVDVAVTISTAGGVTAKAYTTENGSSQHSFPVTISTATDFWLTTPGDYTISALHNSVEIAGPDGTTKKTNVSSDGTTKVLVALDMPSEASSIGGGDLTAEITNRTNADASHVAAADPHGDRAFGVGMLLDSVANGDIRGYGYGGGTFTMTNQTEYAVPIVVPPGAGHLAELHFWLTTNGEAGSVVRGGLRTSSQMWPSALVTNGDLGTVAVSSGAGAVAPIVPGTPPVVVPGTLLWVTLTAQAAASTPPVIRRIGDTVVPSPTVVGIYLPDATQEGVFFTGAIGCPVKTGVSGALGAFSAKGAAYAGLNKTPQFCIKWAT